MALRRDDPRVLTNTMRFQCGCPKCKRSLYRENKVNIAAAKLLGDTEGERALRNQHKLIKKHAGTPKP